MYAERVGPYLDNLEAVRDAPSNAGNFLAKMQIKSIMPRLEALLFPEDDDGE